MRLRVLTSRLRDRLRRSRRSPRPPEQRTHLERATAQAQLELQNLQRQVQAEFQGRLKGVLDELVKGQGVQLVLNADQAVLWSAPGMELTNSVIERLNSQTVATPAKRESTLI